jgi:hypothetical protein
LASMSTFVPGGQAGEESQRITREAELQSRRGGDAKDAEQSKRPSVAKRILRKLRRAK